MPLHPRLSLGWVRRKSLKRRLERRGVACDVGRGGGGGCESNDAQRWCEQQRRVADVAIPWIWCVTAGTPVTSRGGALQRSDQRYHHRRLNDARSIYRHAMWGCTHLPSNMSPCGFGHSLPLDSLHMTATTTQDTSRSCSHAPAPRFTQATQKQPQRGHWWTPHVQTTTLGRWMTTPVLCLA